MGGQAQISVRSPWESLTRPTLGQNLCSRTKGSGNAAWEREYGLSQESLLTIAMVCGALLTGLFTLSDFPFSMLAISSRIAIRASQNRSSSALDSDSVGSTISVPATGNDTVGAWNP